MHLQIKQKFLQFHSQNFSIQRRCRWCLCIYWVYNQSHQSMSMERQIKKWHPHVDYYKWWIKKYINYSHVLECWSLITLLFVVGGRLGVELVIFFVLLSFSSWFLMMVLLLEKVFLLWPSFFLCLVSCLPKLDPCSAIFDEDLDLVVLFLEAAEAELFWFKGAVDLVFNVAR